MRLWQHFLVCTAIAGAAIALGVAGQKTVETMRENEPVRPVTVPASLEPLPLRIPVDAEVPSGGTLRIDVIPGPTGFEVRTRIEHGGAEVGVDSSELR